MSGANELVVDVETLPDGSLLRPKGDVDMARSPALRIKLTEALKGKPARLVVDLSDVPYMDSSGLATLIEALQTTRKIRSSSLCAIFRHECAVFLKSLVSQRSSPWWTTVNKLSRRNPWRDFRPPHWHFLIDGSPRY